jgi:hypothetical protein
MNMTIESLVEAGFTNEQASKILEAHKATLKDRYIPKARFDEVNTELSSARSTITERDGQITELKKFEGTSAELKEKVTALEASNAEETTKHKAEMEKLRLTNTMENQLNGQVHDSALVMSQLDISKISVGNDGKLIGFEDQIKSLKESKAFLFTESVDKEGPKPALNPLGFKVVGKTPPEGGDTPPVPATAEARGKALAERKLSQQKASISSSEHYFPKL